ncbi:MAG: BlaI/MecI/CopY family transcriptional regulator [Acidobacteriota bacterium]
MTTPKETPASPDSGEPLGDRETDLLQALWRLGRPATVSEVRSSLRGAGHAVAYTTVQTMLNRLEKKGRVARSKDGKAHLYAAAVSEESVTRGAVGRLLGRFFGGSAEALTSRLVGDLDADELDRVRRLIDEARGGGS